MSTETNNLIEKADLTMLEKAILKIGMANVLRSLRVGLKRDALAIEKTNRSEYIKERTRHIDELEKELKKAGRKIS